MVLYGAEDVGPIQLCVYGTLMQSLPPNIPFFSHIVALQTKSGYSLCFCLWRSLPTCRVETVYR